MLIEIFRRNPVDLVFKGGTALSFFYGSSRFSEDIDLSSPNIDNYAKIDSALESFEKRYPYKITNDWENEIEQRSSRFRRYFIVFEGASAGNKIATMIDYSAGGCVLGPVKKDISNEFYATKADVMKPEELVAEKVRAMYTREKGRDLYDLYYLTVIRNVAVSRSLIFDKFRENPSLNGKKYSFKSFEARIEKLRQLWGDLAGITSSVERYDFEKVRGEVLAAFRNV